MRIKPHDLERLVTKIFRASGSEPDEACCISEHLVRSNLVGHDSHGVIRVYHYIGWLREQKVFPNRRARLIFENQCLAILDGELGYGQVIARDAMRLGITKARDQGLAAVAVRNSGHMGRIGHWAEMAADAGLISLHFVNTSGLGILVTPFGGINRRLSANPIAAGIPLGNGPAIILDISTSAIAEGKLKVAFNKGVQVPDGCIINPEGRPTKDPAVFYGPPRGAILPFGGHKGYGLGIVAEILAGALCGGGCSKPGVDRLEQGMLTVLFDPRFFQPEAFQQEVEGFVEWVKSSDRVDPATEILVPGDLERINLRERSRTGIELDETTWRQLSDTARALEVTDELLDQHENSSQANV